MINQELVLVTGGAGAIGGHRWLVQRRLKEAYFLMDKKNKRPSEIYLDLGFEDLSHFSFAFKKLFRLTPTELTEQKKNISR